MKMVKSLLLGTAAGLVAMSGAQAADLPVKAKPVQYVKICSLYGAGFYYVPGTDMCLKIGGWVRQYITWNANGSLTNGALVLNTQTRGTTDWGTRTRGYITADARNQTEYGTVRSYIAVGLSAGGAGSAADVAAGSGPGFSANRAFIQFAGFTFGLSQSFYDFYSAPATSFFGGAINPSSDTGDGGKVVTGYTAQFGNGFSASIAAEGRRDIGVINANTIDHTGSSTSAASTLFLVRRRSHRKKLRSGRISWPTCGSTSPGVPRRSWALSMMPAAATTETTHVATFGNPSTVVGWAVGAGAKILTPFIGQGDYFQFQVNYTQGASGYSNDGAVTYSDDARQRWRQCRLRHYVGWRLWRSSWRPATSVQLTTSWGVNAAYEHNGTRTGRRRSTAPTSPRATTTRPMRCCAWLRTQAQRDTRRYR